MDACAVTFSICSWSWRSAHVCHFWATVVVYSISLNRRHPRIVAAASKCSTCTHVQMIPDDGHHASARTVCVVRVVSTTDSSTERLCVQLTVSSNHHHHTRTYLIQTLSRPYPDFIELCWISRLITYPRNGNIVLGLRPHGILHSSVSNKPWCPTQLHAIFAYYHWNEPKQLPHWAHGL